jgi:hypothetical protein
VVLGDTVDYMELLERDPVRRSSMTSAVFLSVSSIGRFGKG